MATTVTKLAVTASDFLIEDNSPFVLSPDGTPVTRTVVCRPLTPGLHWAELRFNTDLSRQPSGAISLKVFGGGPDIDVKPYPTLNFGKVGFVPDAGVQPSQSRKVALFNVGAGAPNGDVAANLHLGTWTDGGWAEPLVEVIPGAGTEPGEFSVDPFDFDNAHGLEAIAGRSILPISVRLTPASEGSKNATLNPLQ